jgi:hypothetical protein
MRPHPTMKFLAIGLMALSGMMSSVPAQETAQPMPLLVAGAMPIYPRTAITAQIQGVVKILVATDGKRPTTLVEESGPPMLVRSAEENIRTWKFEAHKPMKFVTTFEYIIEEPSECTLSNGSTLLRLPLEVRISVKGLHTCDPALDIKPHS